MTRKDVTQDIDRPHYFSQFWIDVAMGKRDVTAGRVAEAETEVDELEDEQDRDIEPTPVMAKATPKPKPASKAPEKKPEPTRPTITSLADLANIDLLMKSSAEMDTDEVPDIESGAIDDLGPLGQESKVDASADTTDFGYKDATEEEAPAYADEEEDFDSGLDYEDDEDDDDWSGPRKPSKQQKQQRRRERRPNF